MALCYAACRITPPQLGLFSYKHTVCLVLFLMYLDPKFGVKGVKNYTLFILHTVKTLFNSSQLYTSTSCANGMKFFFLY